MNIKINEISRKNLADKKLGMSYHERLIKSGAIDLRDNYIVVDLGNGFSRTVPVDVNKLYK